MDDQHCLIQYDWSILGLLRAVSILRMGGSRGDEVVQTFVHQPSHFKCVVQAIIRVLCKL